MQNIDSLRQHHESSVEWRLRREFLEKYWNTFDEDRLLCLASCYVNVKCYRCKYPPDVMKQLVELGAGLSDFELEGVGNDCDNEENDDNKGDGNRSNYLDDGSRKNSRKR